ncbi:CHAT domain-containing protein [Terrabacter sp. C0L_2]|uniref:CHAT domain-containing protein n=1 Tax=Terrabacter sp. C0L_2 TaxID=3108389 RepID=UPI002ED436D4|nr:CHAT domain-containing protein [Terrabacter sp. C0L_2]
MPPQPPGGLPALRLAVRGQRRLVPGAVAGPGAKEFGADLFRAPFNDKALAILRTSQYVSAQRQRGLRLRIRFADATSLANLPWELLYDPERHWYPCQLSRFPTLRFVDLPEPVLPLRVTGPLRMLVVISSPTDLPALEVEREWTLLRTELQPLVQSGRLELVRLPSSSLEDVRETLMHEDFHIFHHIGHGGVDAETGEGHLAFTGPDGRQRRVSGSQLGVMLSNAPIRLAVLNSCEGGRVSDVDPYASTAIALVEQGIPAVVAMQFQITDGAATAFSRTL